ncbi:MAG TPA: glycosyltransferase [Candidatus Paceibacterota bacterium]|nr:glycosyltransferase [Candidatus Paceibacterota bacterium]
MNTRALDITKSYEEKRRLDWAYVTLLMVIAGIALFFIALVKSKTASELLSNPFLLAYSIFVTAFQLSRLVSAIFFKHSYAQVLSSISPAVLEAYEPTVSFVIPCKNEEGAIRNTVTKCFDAAYPEDKKEVIVINDGSTDRTGEILEELKSEYPRLTVITFEKNQGKRYGMAAGFKAATGEIVIQLDSDSYFEPKSFREVLKPFANPEIGGVCAHADPENADQNVFTKMQAAYYFMSFRILKAAESTYGVVFCLSGCSSAYRRSVVMPHLDAWLKERFLGLPVTWGDDRGLTNVVLREGYKAIYTDVAKAYTIVPSNFKQLVKQQVRWKKGWFVNSIFASKFIMKRDPFVAFFYFFPLTLVTLMTPFMATRAVIYNPLYHHNATILFFITGVFLVAALIVVFYRFVGRDNKYWPYIFAWTALNSVFLAFLLFYALATIQNRKWGTR